METMSVIYWGTTGLLALAMSFSAYAYLTQPAMKAAFDHLGYPAHFRKQLAVAKLLGVIVLVVPIGPLLKEWAYAGFAFTFMAALVSHSALGDPVAQRLGPVAVLVLLAASYVTYHHGVY